MQAPQTAPMPDETHANAQPQGLQGASVLGSGTGAGFNARDLVISLIVNGALPFITYRVLRG